MRLTLRSPFLILGLLLSSGVARANTGDALVKKMEAAYAGLKSYSQTMGASGEVVIKGSGRRGGMTATLRYQAPNRLYIGLTNPQVGTVRASTDGKEQVIYFGKRNAYIRTPAPKTLREFLEGLKVYQIVAVLDPLYFLCGEPASKLTTGFTVKGQENVNGVVCDKVVGTLKKNAVQIAESATITLWIDRKTSLLRKTHLAMKGVPVRTSSREPDGSDPEVSVNLADQTLTETIQAMEVNPALRPADLKVVVPKSAKPMRPRSR